jgi:acyl-CoA synthetase (AMP-forming)/AMP-acid ligase II
VGGEILVRIDSEAAFPGYYKDPAATSKRFARDVFVKGDLWYRTGDALRRTSDGKWLFLDRLGDTFRWKSENVSTAEVSEVLGHYPGILEANVYGVSVPGHEGRAGCAALTLEPAVEKTFDFGAFHKYVEAKLPRYAVPVFLRLGQGASHTHNNKQNKAPLKEEGVDPAKVNPNDTILWRKPESQGYTAFTAEDWSHIVGSRVRL